ncbi:MAG TPA: R3H domain-containing nucleic acid-binding protein, partial [Thermoanaerobaculia bacterium]|nr:R3H domain-containing nucleic acid-binding protein [Thermoanaerobaculia bacterium]
DIPHPGIGRARRMQVPSPEEQHNVMIEAVENHMPQVIVIDEIGTAAEAMAARTIAERGVQLIATAHGNALENLLQNPTLSDLVGGIQAVTLSDEEARRRGTQKTVLERRAPPTFDVLIEIQDKDRLAVHHDVAEVVDSFLRDIPARPELRVRTQDGGVEIQAALRQEPPSRRDNGRPENGHGRPGRGRSANNGRRAEQRKPKGSSSPWWTEETTAAAPVASIPLAPAAEAAYDEPPTLSQRPPRGQVARVYAYAVSRDRLERAFRKMRVPALLVDDLEEADMVVTLKAQERRQPRRLREALEKGLPLHIIKSNTLAQMESFVRSHFGVVDVRGQDEEALREVEEAIDEALDQGHAVELPPRNNYLRRLQHQVVERYGLTSESKGDEPYRRVVIYPG